MLKKNTAVTGFPIGLFINATTGAVVTTGTPTCKRILDGTGGACANAASYNSDAGQWEIDLDAADTNGAMVGLSFTLTDCLPITYRFRTVVVDAVGVSTVSSTEILRNIPHIVYFATADTPATAVVTYIHTDATVAVSAIVQHGSTDHYQVHFTPTTCGPWIISIYNAGGDVLHSESFECVDATKAQHSLGLQPPYHGMVDVWPAKVWKSAGAKADLLVASGTPRTWCGVGKHVVPYDGFIYGIKFVGHENLADFDFVQFVSMFSESTDKLTLRSISEDIHAKTPTDGAWDGLNFRTIYFDKPVYAERGDSFGFYGSQSSGVDKVIGIMQEVNTASQTPQETRYISGALNLTDENTTTRDGADPGQRKMLLCKLIMEPPAIVIGGHSFWSGGFISGDSLKSNSVFEDWSVGYNRLGDCASLLSDILGVPCCNCADGGTSIVGWTGASGNFATVVAPLRPRVVAYDTAYNDKDSGTFGGDPTLYPEYLGRLLAQCDQIGAQLILLESPPSRYATTQGKADKLELFNAVAMLWAQHNGVPYVALHHRLGQHSGGDEHDSLRRYQKNGISGVSDYNSSTDSYIHPTVAGQRAAMLALAEAVRFRVPPPRITAPTTTYDEVVPENTIGKTGSADTVTTDSASRLAITDHGDRNWGTATGFATPTNLNNVAVAIHRHITDSVGTLATSAELAATDAKVDDVLEDTGETLPAAITGEGIGARTVTITVTDGSDPIENATVTLTTTGDYRRRTTNALGVAVFKVNDATWTPAVSYPRFTMDESDDDPIVVDEDKAVTYTMTANAAPTSDPSLVTAYVRARGTDGQPQQSVVFHLRGVGTVAGESVSSDTATATSGEDGYAYFADRLPGASYEVRRGGDADGNRWHRFSIPIEQAEDYPIPSVVGQE